MDASDYLRFAAALVAVLALIALCGLAARRWGGTALPAARNRRVRVVEVVPVDARRRLLLVRRDDVEHLLLLGPTQDLLVEPAIKPPAFSADAGADPFTVPNRKNPPP
ncbi:MAG TPA: flagellar biosynthetic protein FliO [Azospirillaceae bacterium]|nr:flagellar biosynthetic protein FliO [Azospirillaceae bacterium]